LQTDKKNCGACGTDCSGRDCIKGVCAPPVDGSVEVTLSASGLPAGNSVVLSFLGQDVALTAAAPSAKKPAAPGASYDTTIKTQPAKALCSLPPNAKGTIGASPFSIDVKCEASAVVLGKGAATLNCGVSAAKVEMDLKDLETAAATNCQAKFDAWETCAVGKPVADSFKCGGLVEVMIRSDGPCGTQYAALVSCLNP